MHVDRRRIRLDPTAGAHRPRADPRRDDEKLSRNGSMSISSGGSAWVEETTGATNDVHVTISLQTNRRIMPWLRTTC